MIHLKFKNERNPVDKWPSTWKAVGDTIDIRFMITDTAPLDDGDWEITLELTDLDV